MALKCVFLNTSLKKSGEKSNTEALFDEAKKVYEKEVVEVEVWGMADYNIPFGVSFD